MLSEILMASDFLGGEAAARADRSASSGDDWQSKPRSRPKMREDHVRVWLQVFEEMVAQRKAPILEQLLLIAPEVPKSYLDEAASDIARGLTKLKLRGVGKGIKTSFPE